MTAPHVAASVGGRPPQSAAQCLGTRAATVVSVSESMHHFCERWPIASEPAAQILWTVRNSPPQPFSERDLR